MCTTALKQEIYQRVEPLSDEGARLVIRFIDSLGQSQAASESPCAGKGRIARDELFGILPGNTVISDDFFETPECFKEYV